MESRVTIKIQFEGGSKALDTIPLTLDELVAAINRANNFLNFKIKYQNHEIRTTKDLIVAYLNNTEPELNFTVEEAIPAMNYMDTSVQMLYEDMINKFRNMSTQPQSPQRFELQNGLLKKLDLVTLIHEFKDTARVRLMESSRQFLEKRQQFYKVDDEKWKEVALEQLQFQELLLNTIIKEVCDSYGITQQVFETSRMTHIREPEILEAFQEFMNATIQGTGEVPDALTKNKLKEILDHNCTFIENFINHTPNIGPMDLILLKVREGDEVMREYGFDENQLAAAMIKYDLDNDSEFADIRNKLDGIMARAFGMPPGGMGPGMGAPF
jgi:hypothetical protein